MHKTIITALALMLCLSGCATSAGYDKLCRQYLHQPATSLMYGFGAPVRSYTYNGLTVMEYYSENQYFVADFNSQTIAVQNENMQDIGYLQQQNPSGRYVKRSCSTTFFVQNGYVVDYKFSGGDCRA